MPRLRVAFIPSASTPNSYLGLVAKGLEGQATVLPNAKWFWPRRGDVLHVHWPEHHFVQRHPVTRIRAWLSLVRLKLLVGLVRLRGGALVWTAHNLAPHDQLIPPDLRRYRRFMDWFLPRVDMAIAMSGRQLPQLLEQFPAIPDDRWRIAAHPAYEFPPPAPRQATRARFAVPADARLVVMVGLVRRYKGIPKAIAAFLTTAGSRDFLVIAGKCRRADVAEEIREAIGGSTQVQFINTRLSDAEISALLHAADLALFNFTAILNSGSVMAALSAGCRVLAPANATFADISQRVGEGWIEQFTQPLRGSDIQSALDARAPAAGPDLTSYTAAVVGLDHMKVYADAIAARHLLIEGRPAVRP